MERERKTRFSGGKLGYLWAYITPVVWIALIVALFWVLQRTPPIHVRAEIFIATGILPYLIFRQTVTSLSRTLAASRYMRYLRPVSNNDIMLATMLLEVLHMLTSAALIFGGVTLLFGDPPPESVQGVVFSLALAWGIGCGVGRFVAAAGLLSDAFSRAVPLILRPLFWLSGIFYTATDLSKEVQDILWYSPFLHITELVRESYFLGYTSPIASVWYPIAVAAGFFLASVPLEMFATRRRIMRGRL
ncbi:capsular polysaccharide transport system permease protein [Litoreibacter meonggei]|uniref:Transport permease protein n=1 Tax=Litoreibacter meonggei TaxID=1049199 RepID=A0A497X3T4_9RHOB|nr:ABC transporter permease [Litoreibacter meonggei]RLJ59543.1 capsular polysaccharide transport system permease protein [Litoreibacter meonggei]